MKWHLSSAAKPQKSGSFLVYYPEGPTFRILEYSQAQDQWLAGATGCYNFYVEPVYWTPLVAPSAKRCPSFNAMDEQCEHEAHHQDHHRATVKGRLPHYWGMG